MAQDKLIGKLSDDAVMSCSRLPALFGWSSFSTPNDELRKSCDAWDRQQSDGPPPAWEYSEPASWGNYMENEILRQTAKRLSLEIKVDIEERVEHETLALQGSIDGILEGDGRVLEHNPAAGIYIAGEGSIVLDGPGIAEAKLTSAYPLPEPAGYRGPAQVQGLMMCTGYTWSAIGTLYRGTELRIYVAGQDDALQEKISQDVIDFAARMSIYKRDGVVDWYPALSPNDAATTYTKSEGDLPPISLNQDNSDLVMDLIAAREAISAATALKNALQTRLMDVMGAHEKAIAVDEMGTAFAEIKWGMTAARKEAYHQAQPAKRAKTISVREV